MDCRNNGSNVLPNPEEITELWYGIFHRFVFFLVVVVLGFRSKSFCFCEL
jgi:hypothetical protein